MGRSEELFEQAVKVLPGGVNSPVRAYRAVDVYKRQVEGYPNFDAVLRRLKERPQVKEVELRPLMTVAGDHAKNDLAGDEPDSWKNILEGMGYQTSCVLTGLG